MRLRFTWHGLCTVTSIHSIQKSTRNSQKLGSKLVLPVSQWMLVEDSIFKTEIELISKKVRRKRKKMFRLRCWLLLHVKQYKNLLKNICHQKMYIPYIHSAGRWSDDEVAMYLLTYHQTNKLVSTNQRANESYSRSSFTRSI